MKEFTINYTHNPTQMEILAKNEEETPEENLIDDKLVVYTALTENNEIITVASCKGCHFSCPHCVEE